MAKKKYKKIVFVIVEGGSDQEALEFLFHAVFGSDEVYVNVVGYDVTSNIYNKVDGIVANVNEIIKSYATKNGLKPSDFKEIIHITDTDGVYIPEECILYDEKAIKYIYSTENIRFKDVTIVKKRNLYKRNNINKLITVHKMWRSIPYSIYYMSSCLDHVLYNKLNSNANEKMYDSYNFVKMYQNKVDECMDYLVKSDFSVCDDYDESWNYIKKNLNSLNRHTNVGICLLKAKMNLDNRI